MVFGESWKAPASDNSGTVVGSLRKRGAASSGHGNKDDAGDNGPAYSLPTIIGLILLVVLILVLVGSGGAGVSTNEPKAMLFVISGLKGTEFMDAVIDGPYAPNIKRLVRSGSYAACLHADDGRCCRTQDGAHLGPDFRFDSAPGIASILTGVNANKHRVNNNSFDAMSHFISTSQQYPTLLKLAKNSGLSTGVVGSKYMMSTLGDTGRCTNVGVVDFECGSDAVARCLARSSCNADQRIPLSPSFSIGDGAPVDNDAREYTRAAELQPSDSGSIFELTNDAVHFINSGTDVTVVHINALELASNNRNEGGDYTAGSSLTMGTLYLVDAVVGQITAVIEGRVAQSRENWLVLGVADHGGFNSTNGGKIDEDEMVAFFGNTYTLGGSLSLQAPFPPVRQFDTAPTLLKWLGVDVPANMDGSVQMICSNGIKPHNCSQSGSP